MAPRGARAATAIVGISLVAVGGAGGCRAPALERTPHDGGLVAPCSPFADLVIEWKPAGGDDDIEGGSAALGPPDDDALAIGPDTALTVSFVGLGAVIDGDGADVGVAVVGAPSGGTRVSGYASADGLDFEYAGELTADATTLDLALTSASTAVAIRLVGLEGELALDAIEAIQATCP